MNKSNDAPLLQCPEFRDRRPNWTFGLPVVLADGTAWHLPKINLAFLMTTPDLQQALIRAFRLSEEFNQVKADDPFYIPAITLFHAQMANIAVQLLQANYDLSDERWIELITFDSLPVMLGLTTRAYHVTLFAHRGWIEGLAAFESNSFDSQSSN